MRLFLIPAFILITIAVTGFIISSPILPDDVATGKKIYENNCSSCHKLFVSFTAEPLYAMIERAPNKEWIYKYINNSAQMIGKDAYAVCLSKKYNGM